MMRYLALSFVLLFSLSFISSASGQPHELRVGFQVEPPFIVDSNGQYSGVSIDLWGKIADSLQVKYTTKAYALDELLTAIQTGEVDVAISPLTVTASRIKKFSFSQPYYITNLAFATKVEKSNDMISFFLDFFSLNFFKAVFSLFFVILIFGFLLWLLERRKNAAQFRPGVDGLGDGIWWSAVTMSTVGYGDKSPTTAWGRVLSIIWMFTAVIIISGLTAGISSSLTIHNLKTEVTSFDDLRNLRVGCIPASGTADFLDRYNIKYQDYSTVKQGLDAVANGTIRAFVYDEAVLTYFVHAKQYDEEIQVIPSAYYREYFSFGSLDIDLLKQIDAVLIGIIESSQWEKDLKKYHIEYRN